MQNLFRHFSTNIVTSVSLILTCILLMSGNKPAAADPPPSSGWLIVSYNAIPSPGMPFSTKGSSTYWADNGSSGARMSCSSNYYGTPGEADETGADERTITYQVRWGSYGNVIPIGSTSPVQSRAGLLTLNESVGGAKTGAAIANATSGVTTGRDPTGFILANMSGRESAILRAGDVGADVPITLQVVTSASADETADPKQENTPKPSAAEASAAVTTYLQGAYGPQYGPPV